MKFNFLSVSDLQNGYAAEQESALGKVMTAMKKGGKLVITPRKDQNGFIYVWIELVLSNKTEGVKLLLCEEVLNFIFLYMTIGKVDDFNLDASKIEEAKNEYADKDFAFELLKYEVEQGKKINITLSNQAKYRCYTTYTNGRVLYSLDMTDEVKAYLEEKDLL